MAPESDPQLDPFARGRSRHSDALIHDQGHPSLGRSIVTGASTYAVHGARLMRTIIWQTRETIARGGREKLTALIARLPRMVTDLEVMHGADTGFRDDHEAHRRLGTSAIIAVNDQPSVVKAITSWIACARPAQTPALLLPALGRRPRPQWLDHP